MVYVYIVKMEITLGNTIARINTKIIIAEIVFLVFVLLKLIIFSPFLSKT